MLSITRIFKVLLVTILLTYTVVSFQSIIDGFQFAVDTIDFILKPIKSLLKNL
jgi:hypothetical protein